MTDLLALAAARIVEALARLPEADAAPALSGLRAGALAAPGAPLGRVVAGFGLDEAEASLVALLAASALSEAAGRALTQAAGGDGVPVWLAQRLIPDLRPAHLSSAGVLSRFALLEGASAAVAARLRLAEAVVDRLAGGDGLDPLVAAHMTPLAVRPALADPDLTQALAAILRERRAGLSPAALADPVEPAAVAAGLASLGLAPWRLAAVDLPEDPRLRDRLARAWSRDAALSGAALVIAADGASAARVGGFVDRVVGHVAVTGLSAPLQCQRAAAPLAGVAPDRRRRWAQALGEARAARLGPALDRVAAQFRLDGDAIDALAARCGAAMDAAADHGAALLWHAAARSVGADAVPGVAFVEPTQDWDDLVLPPALEATLRRLDSHVRHGVQVFDGWGFGRRMGGRGRGVAALFAGPSGTGKTMAAEVLAHSLDLRMLAIDLSQVISKYVGETSKNVAAAFDLAERSGAVMVWNEGDAIWGARGSVGHATDRHVNAEIGDLLQRIEAFQGFTVVTTNLRHAIDPAFLRRFRFVVDFPMPSEAERLRLWRRAFPPEAPVEPLDFRVLAAQPLSGAAIRNIALAAAFHAAERGAAIGKDAIAAELAEELRKTNQAAPRIDWGRAP